jgi:hypothetical protein
MKMSLLNPKYGGYFDYQDYQETTSRRFFTSGRDRKKPEKVDLNEYFAGHFTYNFFDYCIDFKKQKREKNKRLKTSAEQLKQKLNEQTETIIPPLSYYEKLHLMKIKFWEFFQEGISIGEAKELSGMSWDETGRFLRQMFPDDKIFLNGKSY